MRSKTSDHKLLDRISSSIPNIFRHYLIVGLVCLIVVLSACSTSGKLIGQTLRLSPQLKECDVYKQTCHASVGDYRFSYQIEKQGGNTYELSGKAVPTTRGIYSNIRNMVLTFAIIKNGVIVGVIDTSMSGSMNRLRYREKFTSDTPPLHVAPATYRGTVTE